MNSTCLTGFLLLFFVLACSEKESVMVPEDFEIEDGFTLARIAAEPLIRDPVDLEFNERGDAMVLEMPGYPHGDKQSRLIILADRDNDGVYDSSHVFCEGLLLANSFMHYKRGALVAAPPYLLFVRDDDQNYIPERIDTLMGGLANDNLQHNYNGLFHGLDNWIYAANGGNDGRPFWWGDTTTALDLRGQDFRFNLETRQLERLGESSGGFGLATDGYGRIFETHNLEHVSHLVFPDRYILGRPMLTNHTLQNVSDHEENGLARIYPIGEQQSRVNHPEQSGYFSGACGITWYGGGAFGDEYENTVWVADVVLNLIHVDKIAAKGSSFTASRMHAGREFLASLDRAFRPVNMTVGPDGSLYVVDMYREVIEHPEWIPDEIEATLDLDAGKDKGRIYRISRADSNTAFEPATFTSASGLINALPSGNQWVRNTAHRLLMERDLDGAMRDGLTRLLRGSNAVSKVHALHLLAAHDALGNGELVALLKDHVPEVNEAALQVAESRNDVDGQIIDAVNELLAHPDMRVRMHAALTVSTFRRNDPQLVIQDKSLWNALVSLTRGPADEWLIEAVTLAAIGREADLFAEHATGSPVNGPLLAALAVHACEKPASLQKVMGTLAGTQLTIPAKRRVLQVLADHARPNAADGIEADLTMIEQTPYMAPLLPEVAALRARLRLPPSAEFVRYSKTALKEVQNSTLADSVRLHYLALLEFLPYANKADVLFQCLRTTEPVVVQEQALKQLAAYSLPEIGWRIVRIWPELTPGIRRYAGDLLLYNEVHHDALLNGIESGTINIGEMNFDLERRRMLLYWTDNDNTKKRAARLFSDAGVSNRQDVIAKMKPALHLKGSPANGEKVFLSVCSNCHVYGTRGKSVGPVLTEIRRKSKETLLHDILDPNAAADPRYINHRIETKDGLVHIGIIAGETDRTLTILKIGGEAVTVRKSDIKAFRSLGSSLMMEGLENSLSHQELADLLAFLQEGGPVETKQQ